PKFVTPAPFGRRAWIEPIGEGVPRMLRKSPGARPSTIATVGCFALWAQAGAQAALSPATARTMAERTRPGRPTEPGGGFPACSLFGIRFAPRTGHHHSPIRRQRIGRRQAAHIYWEGMRRETRSVSAGHACIGIFRITLGCREFTSECAWPILPAWAARVAVSQTYPPASSPKRTRPRMR